MSEHHVIFVSDGAWRIGLATGTAARIIPLTQAPGASLADHARHAQEELAASGYEGHPVVLVIPSNWCLNAAFPCDRSERVDRHGSLAYRLEEYLPISAEDFVADYRPGDGVMFGVCTETARLREIVAALEAAGIPVRHICPRGLLVAVHVGAQNRDAAGILIGEGSQDGFDLLCLEKGRPSRWAWFAADGPDLHAAVTAALAAPDAGPFCVVGLLPEIAEVAAERGASPPRLLAGLTPDLAAALECAGILEGAEAPWIDLRRDALASSDRLGTYRKPLLAVAAAVTFFLLCISLAAFGVGRRYQAQARQQQAGQIAVFKRLYPEQRIPASVAMRLQNEQRRLAALNGETAEDTSKALLSQTSALVSLHDALAGLPTDSQCQILELDIQPELVHVDGKAGNLVDADRLAGAFRKAGFVDVDAPKSEALKDGGVSFGFGAKPRKSITQEVAHARP